MSERDQRSREIAAEIEAALDSFILYLDDDLLCVNKPSGIPMTPSWGYDVSLTEVLRSATDNSNLSPAHLLDRETSGAVVFGLTKRGLARMAYQFRQRMIEKNYLALVGGRWAKVAGVVAPMIKGQIDKEEGKISATGFSPIAQYLDERENAFTLLSVRLLTGRTHQIRAHLSHLRLPIVADWQYGSPFTHSRFLLHCYRLSFHPPASEEKITVTAPVANDFCTYTDGLLVDHEYEGKSWF